MNPVAQSLLDIKSRIAAACERAGRDKESVHLVAVSKTFPEVAIQDAMESGHVVFGESRLQEAEPKVAALSSSIEWHFIGRVQRNKVRKILPLVDVVHGIDSMKLAKYTDRVAEELRMRAKVFIQVNIGREESKGGFEPDGLVDEMGELLKLPSLEILGLMCIPPAEPDAESARQWFQQLRELKERIEQQHDVSLPHLSMGMSGDYEVAVEEGATYVRVGSAIFGNRSYRVEGEMG